MRPSSRRQARRLHNRLSMAGQRRRRSPPRSRIVKTMRPGMHRAYAGQCATSGRILFDHVLLSVPRSYAFRSRQLASDLCGALKHIDQGLNSPALIRIKIVNGHGIGDAV